MCFNPRTHEGCDGGSLNRTLQWQSFNPRTHEGCDSTLTTWVLPRICFNPRTHEGCDTLTLAVVVPVMEFQSTHPRGVRLCSFCKSCCLVCVSIHAPTRGATNVLQICIINIRFQSTHPRGVRLLFASTTKMPALFQSTHPRGVRQDGLVTLCPFLMVSIHAPTRGATSIILIVIIFKLFQSTHPRGVRPILSICANIASKFQSTHPRGVRHDVYANFSDYYRVSIHAPTRGATPIESSSGKGKSVSIHAPTRGATCSGDFFTSCFDVSIHAPTRGATQLTLKDVENYEVSIHAPTRGATRSRGRSFGEVLFQSTHPRGVRPHILQNTEY